MGVPVVLQHISLWDCVCWLLGSVSAGRHWHSGGHAAGWWDDHHKSISPYVLWNKATYPNPFNTALIRIPGPTTNTVTIMILCTFQALIQCCPIPVSVTQLELPLGDFRIIHLILMGCIVFQTRRLWPQCRCSTKLWWWSRCTFSSLRTFLLPGLTKVVWNFWNYCLTIVLHSFLSCSPLPSFFVLLKYIVFPPLVPSWSH